MTPPLRIAILASGSGSNLEAILRSCEQGSIHANPVALLCNNPGARCLERAESYAVPALVADHREFRSRRAHEERIIEFLEPHEPQMLVLAGYMRIVTPRLIEAFHGRFNPGLPGVMNIHPADTTLYQGAHGYEFALGLLPGHPARLEETKITVHFVDAGVDTGPVIGQERVAVLPDDTIETLRTRGLAVEHRLYPECIDRVARGQIEVVNGKVRLRDGRA